MLELSGLVTMAVRQVVPLAREKGLTLKFVRCSLSVRSDRRLLRRLLQNLVSNAVKYTPQGRVLIGCRHRAGKLRIDVYDTGLGIPQGKKRVIFHEFQRLDEGARVARGLGLGLSIVERIERVLSHKLDVRSQAGRGSRFSVEVPLSSALKRLRKRSYRSSSFSMEMLAGSSSNWCSAWSSFSYSTLSCRNDHSALTSPRRITASTLRYWLYCTAAMAT